MSLLNKLFHFVLLTTKKYDIDESHGLSHSMNVLKYANEIYEEEVSSYPILKKHEKIIYVAAALHDMCDKKYMNQADGLNEIEKFLTYKLTPIDSNIVKWIISTMSYSTVKAHGFPELGPYNRAYHIVREADLLAAYDFDRCMIYKMYKQQGEFEDAYKDAVNLFNNRVLKHNDDCLFITKYGKKKSLVLESQSLKQMDRWKKLIKNPVL